MVLTKERQKLIDSLNDEEKAVLASLYVCEGGAEEEISLLTGIDKDKVTTIIKTLLKKDLIDKL